MQMLVVHIGAGHHGLDKAPHYKKLLKKSLTSSNLLQASKIVEASPLTNTGYGSCLNLEGKVECDASFVHVTQDGVVQGSLVGIDDAIYPIEAMYTVYDDIRTKFSSTNMNKYRLTMPIRLNYTAYKPYSEVSREEKLVLSSSQRFYDKHISIILNSDGDTAEIAHESGVSDTIGLIEIDNGSTRVATSSGGNYFKIPGRIGCAGEVGCAIDYSERNGVEISASCSGNGEDILQSKLANYVVNNFDYEQDYLAQHLVELVKHHCLKFNLFARGRFSDDPIVYVGIIVVVNDKKSGRIRLVYCHSTESFYFGFRNLAPDPTIVLSRLDNIDKAGTVFACGEFKGDR